MKTTVGVLLALLILAPAAYATDIAVITAVDANCYPLYYGAQVTIEGLVVSGTELGSAGPAYIEDATGGVAFYFYPMPFVTGDYVELTSWVDFYNGLIELADEPGVGTPPTWTIMSSGNPVTPHVLTIPALNEAAEGLLVKCESVFFPEADGVATFSYTHSFQDGDGNVGTMYTDTSTDIDGTIIPMGCIDLVGCVGQYDNSGPEYCDGYQVIPRSLADIMFGASATEKATWSGVKSLYR